MYPKKITVYKDGELIEFLYRLGYHEYEFEVFTLDHPERKAIFSFEIPKNVFSFSGDSLGGFEKMIGEQILSAEY